MQQNIWAPEKLSAHPFIRWIDFIILMYFMHEASEFIVNLQLLFNAEISNMINTRH